MNKICKGVVQDTAALVTAGVFCKQWLAGQDDRIVTAVTAVVDERTKNLQFYTNSAVKLAVSAMKKLDEGLDMFEHKVLSEVLRNSKEVALGKDVIPIFDRNAHKVRWRVGARLCPRNSLPRRTFAGKPAPTLMQFLSGIGITQNPVALQS